jgi:serine/threonine protein phosphatase PrpC
MRGGIFLEVIINYVKAHFQLFLFLLILISVLIIGSILLLLYLKKKKNNKRADSIGRLQVSNVHNIGNRESQQDSFGVSDLSNKKRCAEKGVFAVVADGMGGLAGGAEISAIVTSYMLNYFSGSTLQSKIPGLLLDMLYGANKEVRNYLNNNDKQQSGSTLVAAIIKDNILHFLTVGDSRIYLCRGGSFILLNREHNYGSELDEKAARGEISLEEARCDSQRNALTSYIGQEEIVHVDRNIRPIMLLPGDRIYLMSDGIFGTLTEDEILATAAPDIFETAIRLERAVLNKGKKNQDNFTSVNIEIHS